MATIDSACVHYSLSFFEKYERKGFLSFLFSGATAFSITGYSENSTGKIYRTENLLEKVLDKGDNLLWSYYTEEQVPLS